MAARRREGHTGIEDVARAKATVGVAVVAAPGCDPGVTGCDDDTDALHAKLHELVALTLLVICWKIVLLLAVTDADHIRRLVDAALPLALEST